MYCVLLAAFQLFLEFIYICISFINLYALFGLTFKIKIFFFFVFFQTQFDAYLGDFVKSQENDTSFGLKSYFFRLHLLIIFNNFHVWQFFL